MSTLDIARHFVALCILCLALGLSSAEVVAQGGAFTAGAASVSQKTYRLIGVVGAAVPAPRQALLQRKQAVRSGHVAQDGPVGIIPEDFSLRANYPNPFQHSTTIRFGLPQDAHVELTVFDLLGRTVRTVVDSVQPAGIHLKRLDGGDLPSGVYLYRLQAESFSAVRTMMIIR